MKISRIRLVAEIENDDGTHSETTVVDKNFVDGCELKTLSVDRGHTKVWLNEDPEAFPVLRMDGTSTYSFTIFEKDQMKDIQTADAAGWLPYKAP